MGAVSIIPFAKMSGAGNDFVLVDNRRLALKDDLSRFARIVSERRTGVGADGVLILQESSKADFLMKYYNSDGSYGAFCGNGGRCVARYAFLNGISSKHVAFEALGYVYQAEVQETTVRLKMKEPKGEELGATLQYDGKFLRAHILDTGAPHVVVFLDENPVIGSTDLAMVDVAGLGREIRFSPRFGAQGTNVNFVVVNADGSLGLRTYERGVEGETLACGTGSVASALIASRVKGLHSPQKIIPKSKEPLIVEFLSSAKGFADVFLEGNADIVFKGELKYDTVLHKLIE
jgi:diaminopimelate epimerase